MGLFDRLFGREEQPRNRDIPAPPPGQGYSQQGYGLPQYGQAGSGAPAGQRSEDEIAVERYRYLLRTAPPETIEQVHEEAFAKLTPEQRRMVFDQLSANAPAGERPRGDDPRSLAQAATRSEFRSPGTLERSFAGTGRGYGGPGFGSMLGASLLGTVAGYVVGSALVGAMFGGFDGDGGANDAGADSGDAGADSGDAGADSGDAGADADFAGGDMGGGWGDGGGFGDFGGGDFGGDFGGF